MENKIKQAQAEPVRSTGWAAKRDHHAVPVLFSPYTGEPRDVRDVQSDPHGILIQPPGAAMLTAPPPPAAEPSRTLPSAERRLRRLLCLVKHGHSAYMDDGEASDCSVHPSIDYLRDSLDEIEAKWRMRASATPAAPTEPGEAQDAARYRWLRDSEEGVEFRDGRGRWRADCPSGADLDAAIDAALRAAAAARKA